MEPLGAIASLATVLSVVGNLNQLIRSLCSAPDELLTLGNEVADLDLVLSEIESLDRNRNLVRESSNILTKLLIRARILLDGVNRLILEIPRGRADAIAPSQRLEWLVLKRRKAIRLQLELRDTRMNISTVLSGRAV